MQSRSTWDLLLELSRQGSRVSGKCGEETGFRVRARAPAFSERPGVQLFSTSRVVRTPRAWDCRVPSLPKRVLTWPPRVLSTGAGSLHPQAAEKQRLSSRSPLPGSHIRWRAPVRKVPSSPVPATTVGAVLGAPTGTGEAAATTSISGASSDESSWTLGRRGGTYASS